MKRNKRLLILLGVLAVACLATVLVSNLQTHKEQIRQTDAVVLQVSPDSVTRLSWETNDMALSFKKDTQWLYEEDSAFPVNEEKVSEILALFSQFGVSFIIEDAENLTPYGLNDPDCTVRLETGDTAYEIKLGGFSTIDEKRYVSVGDGNVYLVDEDPITYFGDIQSMIANDTIPEFDTVTNITVTGEDSYTAVFTEENTYTYSDDDEYFRQDSKLPLDSSKLKTYLKKLNELALTDYITYTCTEADLAGCGLDDPDMTVSITDASGTFAITVSSQDDAYYARIGTSPILYALTKAQYDTVCGAAFDSLRHEKLFYGDFWDVSQVEFGLDGELHPMDVTGDYTEQTWYYNDEEVSGSVLQASLATLRVASFTDEAPTQKEELSIVFTLNTPHCPALDIKLYRYDGSYCLAVIDGQSVGLVEREDVVDITEKLNKIILG